MEHRNELVAQIETMEQGSSASELAVIGHTVRSRGSGIGKAVPSWSKPLFNALAQDDLRALEELVEEDSLSGERGDHVKRSV